MENIEILINSHYFSLLVDTSGGLKLPKLKF